jgi:hypothetical protein
MKTSALRLLSIAGIAASALAVVSPALAHNGYYREHVHYAPPHFAHRVVVVRPVFAPAPVVVYPGLVYPSAPVYYAAPAPVYYAPAPAYYAPNPAGTIGGAIAGAAIGGIASHGRPGAIVAGSVIGAVVGSTLPR